MTTPAEIIAADEFLRQALGLPAGDFKFGFQVRVYNWRMRHLRQLAGLTQRQLGQLVSVSNIGHIETFKSFPSREVGERIAKELRVSREELFPEWLKFYILDRSSREFVSTSLELQQAVERALPRRAEALSWGRRLERDQAWEPTMVKPAVGDSVAEAETEMWEEQIDAAVREAIETLTPQEQKVLILRFGLDGGGSRTLDEVGRVFDRTGENIRRIEARALRKLRHPARSKSLRPLLEA